MDLRTMGVAAAAAWMTMAAVGAEKTADEDRAAVEVSVRDGVGRFLAKARAGGSLTVAYLGGSITAMNGWRNMTTDWLRQTYPKATFKEINAAIGGTGSSLGVFRVGHDALAHNPDLLFVEFATNDTGAQPKDIRRQMDGIVRQTWRKNPETDIVFTYTICAYMTNSYGRGVCPRAAGTMERLADHYGIPSICFGPRVMAEVKAGRLVMSRGELATAVPKETPNRDKAIAALLAREGKTLFAKDGVHPGADGHAFYLKSIIAGFTQMKDMPPADHAARMKTPFVANSMEYAHMAPITPAMLTGSWKKMVAPDYMGKRGELKRFAGRMGTVWEGDRPGDTLRFRFKGTDCAIYDLLGPDGGKVKVKVDGKLKWTYPRFDSYCTYYRLASVPVFNGADSEHEVEITVDSEQPSRQPVAHRLKDPEKELSSPKYDGTGFWPGAILLNGKIVD